jgi:hypothetical protein
MENCNAVLRIMAIPKAETGTAGRKKAVAGMLGLEKEGSGIL